MTADDAEAQSYEYVLGLSDVGPEMREAAWAIFQRACTRDVHPVLRRQRNMLAQTSREAQAGLPVTHSDEAIAALESQMASAWTRCLEQLRTLWLTSPHAAVPEEVVP